MRYEEEQVESSFEVVAAICFKLLFGYFPGKLGEKHVTYVPTGIWSGCLSDWCRGRSCDRFRILSLSVQYSQW